MDAEYRQFVDTIAAAASVPAGPHPFAWLAGDWLWHGEPIHFDLAPYGVSRYGVPYLIYNAPAGMWLLAHTGPEAYGLLIGTVPAPGDARFTGELTIAGEDVILRQNWRTIRTGKVQIDTERKSGAEWTLWERGLLESVTL